MILAPEGYILILLVLPPTQRPEVRQRIESGFCRAGGATASCSRTTRLSWNYRLAHIYSVFILDETRNIKEVNQMTALPSASRTPFTNPAAHPRLRVLRGGSSRGWCSWQRIPLWQWRCQWWWSWTGCPCRRSLGPGTSGHSICQCEGPLGGEGGWEEYGQRGGRKKRRCQLHHSSPDQRVFFLSYTSLVIVGNITWHQLNLLKSGMEPKIEKFWFRFRKTRVCSEQIKFGADLLSATICHLSGVMWHLRGRNKGEMAGSRNTHSHHVLFWHSLP